MTSDLSIMATSCTGLFTGAAVYITLVEHPARMQCGTEIAATEWAPSYKRATVMQASLALLGSGAGFVQWLLSAAAAWLVGTILIFAVVPFTILVILPTNKRLLEPSRDKSSDETRQLLDQWGRLHAVRTALSLAAFLAFLLA